MRNRGHEVDPVGGTSFQNKIPRFLPRVAQGPHKVDIGRVVPEANLVKIGNVDKTWVVRPHFCYHLSQDLLAFFVISSLDWEAWKPIIIENALISKYFS